MLATAPRTASPSTAMEIDRLSVPSSALSRDLRTALRRARDLGFRGVELDARGGLEPLAMTQTGTRQIRKWLGDEGVVVSAVSFRTRGGYADAERLEGRIAATKSALTLAHALGAGVVLNHVGDIPPDAAAPAWRLLVDVLADLGRFAQHVGAALCVEAGRAAPADLVRLMAALPEAALTCDLVTGALVVHGHDPVAAVETLAGHVASVHATDAVAGAFAGRGRAVILGTGQVDFPAVFAALEERGYRGWVGLEPVEERSARQELAAAREFLHGL
jgi:sugar phosphate isomerase/epimerase